MSETPREARWCAGIPGAPIHYEWDYSMSTINDSGDTVAIFTADREAQWEGQMSPAPDPARNRFRLLEWMTPQADLCPTGCATSTDAEIPHDVLCLALFGMVPFTAELD